MTGALAVPQEAAAAWPCLRPFVRIAPGVVVQCEASGVQVRMGEDGHLGEVGEIPRRRSIASDPTAIRRPR